MSRSYETLIALEMSQKNESELCMSLKNAVKHNRTISASSDEPADMSSTTSIAEADYRAGGTASTRAQRPERRQSREKRKRHDQRGRQGDFITESSYHVNVVTYRVLDVT